MANKLLTSRAITRVFSIEIVISIIAVAFAGYGVGYLSHSTHPASSSTTSGSPVTITEYRIISEYVTYNVTTSRSCTIRSPSGGDIVSLTTTTYIEPTDMSGYFNATITAVSSSTPTTNVYTTK